VKFAPHFPGVFMKNYLVKCLFVFLFFNLSVRAVLAFEEEHEAHEHGHATLMLVQVKDALQLVFKSPAMNIIGFEHKANSPEQSAKIEWAKMSLSDAAQLFSITQSAQCALEHVHIKSSLLETDDHTDDHEVHGSHKENDDNDSHSEFEAEYHFECSNISELKSINVAFFEIFTSIEELETHVITASGQKLLELDLNNISIRF
jgi:hypothetical protein